ncbi:MAG: hypothetical protein WC331_10405 [Candidatus Omnitrophota bacterium]
MKIKLSFYEGIGYNMGRNKEGVMIRLEKVATITTLFCLSLMIATTEIGVVMKRIILRPAEAPLCACGCGLPVLCSKGRPYHWNKYLYKHISKTAEHKALMSTASIKCWTNRKHKASSRKLMSIAHTDVPLSFAHRQSMRKAQKGRIVTWGAAISAGKKGKPIWSLAERKRIGEQNRNRAVTDVKSSVI